MQSDNELVKPKAPFSQSPSLQPGAKRPRVRNPRPALLLEPLVLLSRCSLEATLSANN